MKIINLISGPRNLSTAIMYSFAQRQLMKVLDEPFYGYYLKNSDVGITHPSQDAIVETMELKEETVVETINKLSEKTNVFVKGMAHHYITESPSFILNWNNVILIRHPKKLIASFSKVIENPTLADIGLKKASELFLFLKNQNMTPTVIDSDELLKEPENYLRKICAQLKLPFDKNMLSWQAGGISEDGIWAKQWYKNVHNSTGFSVQKSSSQPLPKHLEPLLAEAMPYYRILQNHILKND